MSDDTTFYRAPSGDYFKVTIEPDQDATSPREWTNVTTLITYERDYGSPDDANFLNLPDEYVSHYSGVDSRRAAKWLTLSAPDVMAFVFLQRNGYDGSLSFDTEASDGRHYDGIGVVLRADWDACMGADYDGPITPMDTFKGEVEVYSAWATGEFAGFITEKVTSTGYEDVESVWGYESFDVALTAALESLGYDESTWSEVDEAEVDEAEWNETGEVLSIPADTRDVWDESKGRWTVQVATCGQCGRSWNDAASTSVTPTPSARCPFESMHDDDITARLDYLRGEIETQRISYGEIAELQGLADHIDPGDTVLLEWAGVPEFADEDDED